MERKKGSGGGRVGGVMSSFHIYPYISGPNVIVEEEIWSLGERFRSEIFFLPSENDINFKRRTTFISHTQIYFLKQQELKHSYVS